MTEGLKNVTAGANPMSIKRGIDAAAGAVVESLKSQSKDLPDSKQIANVATISSNAVSYTHLTLPTILRV